MYKIERKQNLSRDEFDNSAARRETLYSLIIYR